MQRSGKSAVLFGDFGPKTWPEFLKDLSFCLSCVMNSTTVEEILLIGTRDRFSQVLL